MDMKNEDTYYCNTFDLLRQVLKAHGLDILNFHSFEDKTNSYNNSNNSK